MIVQSTFVGIICSSFLLFLLISSPLLSHLPIVKNNLVTTSLSPSHSLSLSRSLSLPLPLSSSLSISLTPSLSLSSSLSISLFLCLSAYLFPVLYLILPHDASASFSDFPSLNSPPFRGLQGCPSCSDLMFIDRSVER